MSSSANLAETLHDITRGAKDEQMFLAKLNFPKETHATSTEEGISPGEQPHHIRYIGSVAGYVHKWDGGSHITHHHPNGEDFQDSTDIWNHKENRITPMTFDHLRRICDDWETENAD